MKTRSEVYRILRRALTRIEQGWTKGTWARNKYGKSTQIDSDSACKFCIEGALDRAKFELDLSDEFEKKDAEDFLVDAIGTGAGVISFNDNSKAKKADVVAVFKKALAAAA